MFLTFEPVNEILKFDHSMKAMLYVVALIINIESGNEIIQLIVRERYFPVVLFIAAI